MSILERYYLDNLEKLYEQSLMKWGFDWLPATPPGTYLHSLDEFTRKMESDKELYKHIKVKHLNIEKDTSVIQEWT